MAEEIQKTDQVIPGQTPTEVVRLDGKAGASSSEKNLEAMFDLAQTGTPIADAAKEVMTPEKQKEKEDEEKEVEKKEKTTTQPAREDKKGEAKDDKKDKEEDARASLLKSSEQAKDESVKAKTDEEEVPEEELKVQANDKPRTARRIQALLKKIDQVKDSEASSKKELATRDEKLSVLEKELKELKSASPQVTDEIKTQLEDLKAFRRRYQLDSDPEVKERFDGRIQSAEKSIETVLKDNTASDALLKMISNEGGWLKFASSSKLIPMKDEDGQIKNFPASYAAKRILEELNAGDRQMLDAAVMEQVSTKREKDRFFESETKQAAEYFKKKEEEAKQGSEQYKKQVESARKAIDEFKNKTLSEAIFKERELPESATEDQKQAIEADNEYTRQLRKVFEKNLSVNDVDGMLQIAKESVLYFEERRNNQRLSAKVSKLESDLKEAKTIIDKHKRGSASVPKSGSIAPGASSAAKPTVRSGPRDLEEALALREDGKLSDDGKVTDED